MIVGGIFLGAILPAVVNSSIDTSGGLKPILTLIELAGLVIYCVGLGIVARTKGHSAFWGLTGLLCMVGGIAVAFLKNRNSTPNLPPTP
jgi:hypothetical protein